jgi:hypothetical protein
MLTFLMPVGNPIYFEDNTNSNKYSNVFGFVFATVQAPSNLYAPTLPTRALNKNKIPKGPTICPTGTWSD